MSAAAPDWRVPALRAGLALSYPFLAHAASLRDSGGLAAAALGAIVLMLLAEGLLHGRPRTWLALLVAVAGLAALARSPHAQLPLLLVPVLFIALVATWFGRSLRAGRIPLITRIVAALERQPAQALAPELRTYTRRLTLAWAAMLGLLAACNLVLALLAVPGGLLVHFGADPPIAVGEAQWSWFANGLNYGLVGGFFVLEYLYRKRRFPGRYRNFADFLRRMAGLGPAFWRDLLR